MTANDRSDSDSHSSTDDGRETIDAGTENHTQPTRVRLKAGDLEAKISAPSGDAEELSELASSEMEKLMEKRMLGEYQMLEEKEFHSILLGGE
jgi:hypothetical protein